MKRKALVITLILALSISATVGTQLVNFTSAQDFVTIKADGSIDPSTAPIQRNGDVYTVVGDIDDHVLLERNNTIFDCAGHAVGGIYGPIPVQVGIDVQVNATTNMKVVNAVINGDGIFFLASYNSIFANNTLNNGIGLDCDGDGNVIANNTVNSGRGIASSGNGNMISGNHLTNCNYTFTQNNPSPYGIIVGDSNNTVVGNYIVGTNGTGINLGSSHKNTIIGNHLTDNKVGISTATIYSFDSVLDNMIYYNNFINNTKNVYNELIGPFATVAVNIWDNGAVGNYWSDYNGADADGDEIGDTPYVIDASNQDNYPLMEPIVRDTTPPAISIISPEKETYPTTNVSLTFTVNKPVLWMFYSLDEQANVVITGNTSLTNLSEGSHSLTVSATSIFGNTGTSGTSYFTIDTTSPNIVILSPENETHYTTNIPLNFIVNEAVSWMGYSLDGKINVTITGNVTLPELSGDSHNLTVYANDTAGNMGTSETITFIIAEEPEPFPVVPVAAVSAATLAVVGGGLLVYFKKRKR